MDLNLTLKTAICSLNTNIYRCSVVRLEHKHTQTDYKINLLKPSIEKKNHENNKITKEIKVILHKLTQILLHNTTQVRKRSFNSTFI